MYKYITYSCRTVAFKIFFLCECGIFLVPPAVPPTLPRTTQAKPTHPIQARKN